jgi:hypothetical protein
MLCLLGRLPDRVNGSRTDGRHRAKFVRGNVERRFPLDPVPIRERTALNVGGNSLVCLAHRVGAEVGKAPLHDGFIFFWSSKWAAGKARGGRISKAICNRSGSCRMAAGPFSTQPSGPRPVGCFSVRRLPDSLDPCQFRYGRFARALKNSQPTCGDVTIKCETVH